MSGQSRLQAGLRKRNKMSRIGVLSLGEIPKGENRRPAGLPKAVKIARHDHNCGKCGGLIKKGDKMTMRMYKLQNQYSCLPTCLKCDGRYPELLGGR